MDRPTLIKVETKKNTYQVAFFGLLIIDVISVIYIPPLIDIFKIATIGILTVLCIITFALTVYYNTIVDRYSYLYNIKTPNSNCKESLDAIVKDKVIIPEGFLSLNKDFGEIYNECLYTYLYGFPNSSLPTSVRCLEIGLKEKYKILKNQTTHPAYSSADSKFLNAIDSYIRTRQRQGKPNNRVTIDDINLFKLIQYAEDYYPKKTETLHYLRSLRNFIHSADIIKNNDAYSALTKITDILNVLFKVPDKIRIDVKCKICGDNHPEEVFKSEYFIGNNKILMCRNQNVGSADKVYVVTLMPNIITR